MVDKPTDGKEQTKEELNIFDPEVIESVLQMSDEQKAELDALYAQSTDRFQVGQIIHGKVISREGSGIVVDIEYKSDGIIPSYEFSDFELKKIVPGSEIEVLLDRLEDEDGAVVLSYQKAKSLRAWDNVLSLAEKEEPVRGVVTHKVKGGLSVDIGIPAFLPGSQVDIQRVTNFDQFVGQEVTCKILKVNKRRGNVIVSRRKYLEEMRLEERGKALETLAEDQVLQGIVKNITNYGVFVDIGGIDGLLHITDMSWGRISHPSELVRIGDTIAVKVITFDKKHEKISLGMKQLEENPWEKVEDRYPIGNTIKGRISSITDYGLFVEIEKGIEGLVHISEISWTERITNLAKHYAVGDEIEVIVVALDKENRRMSLSVKQLSEDPWKVVADKFKIGDKITGKISNITDFGIFVQLYDGVDGLVHISDISWTEHIAHPADRYKKGDDVDAVVLAIDPDNKKISLGIKQLDRDPWENISEEYPIGKIVEGTVSKVTNFGAFIKLPTGIEGLVHISELSSQEVEKVEDVIKVGQTEQFKVIKASKEERKLGLSLKAMQEPAKKGAPIEQAAKAPEAPRPVERKQKARSENAHSGGSMKTAFQRAFEEHAEKMKKQDDEDKGQ